MSTDILKSRKEEIFRLANAAMRRAAISARETAIATGTAIVVVENSKLVRIPAAELQRQKAAGEWRNIQVEDRSQANRNTAVPENSPS